MGFESVKYTLAAIWRNGRYLYWWKNRFIELILSKILFRSNDGTYILNEDWNNLIILDACRYDIFEEEIKRRNLKGKLEHRISRGTDTPTFLIENFGDGKFNDIVYVTANPFVNKFLKDKFYKIIPVWDKGWSDQYRTVLPSTVYEYTLKALAKYPDKRLIIHFMQPHHPFIALGDIGDEGFRSHIVSTQTGERTSRDVTVWDLLERGKISKEKVWWGYKKNLKLVMPYVEKLINILPGRTVVTSDHGNAIGEYIHSLIPLRVYGHPSGVRIEPLVKVPWFIVESKDKDRYNIEKELIAIGIKKLKQDKKI
ncbi:hypothetical protein [Archaeoglobus veneficus]|uniref:Uncharacterized protein n=1 Tax=Archaeoglobus veneficus (strain DSM 11195 / SNP6) TaxID=693661 RepID=F2KQM1_ARCVS|nr:hypothetical protein [Archaeoglobus veneficus]AEA46583.1 hypothetical protein Arcve_0559 [Archaeoglobus veneficus SNP6]